VPSSQMEEGKCSASPFVHCGRADPIFFPDGMKGDSVKSALLAALFYFCHFVMHQPSGGPSGFSERIMLFARWMAQAKHLVIFTGAGISTESGLPDYRGPEGVWTRREKGLPVPEFDWASAKPNASHRAIFELQQMGKLGFLITQNVDNLHLESGIEPDLLAELHGNIMKLRCSRCGFKCDHFPDLVVCPNCEVGRLSSSVVNFGDPMPEKEVEVAVEHSRRSDLFVVAGSSLTVYPAADMPRIALAHGAKLVIINQGETPLDALCHLRFHQPIGEVLPPAVNELKRLLGPCSQSQGRSGEGSG